MVTFAAPERLALLVLPAVAALLVLLRHRRRRVAQRRLASPAVWERLLGGTPATGLVRLLAWCLAAALLVVALARPQWGKLPVHEDVRSRDLVIALDVSDSMRCPDLEPSRLGRSLEVLQRALPALAGNRVGVVVFAGDAYPLVPLTTDVDAVATFLASVEPGMVALPGSNLERAVASALDLLPDEGEGRMVVLVSDGENLQGDLDHAVGALRRGGARLLAVMAGTEAGGPIPVTAPGGGVRYKRDKDGRPVVTRADRATLSRLADATGGELVTLEGVDAERRLAAAVDKLQTHAAGGGEHTVRRVERFQVFLVAAAVALLAGFAASPWRRLAVAVVVLCLGAGGAAAQQSAPAPGAAAHPPAQTPAPRTTAAQLAPWWQRVVPGGSRRLARTGLARWRHGDLAGSGRAFAGAASLDPTNPDRLYDLGTVAAAAGHLDQAAAPLAAAHRAGSPSAAYNLGTAALQAKRGDEAVQWLRQALLRAPDDVDAKRNYELALKLQEKQKKQKQQQKKDKDTKDKSDDQKGERQPTPTPRAAATPTPRPQPRPGEATPTPAPTPTNPLYGALERAEAQARNAMQRPTPRAVVVEKDW